MSRFITVNSRKYDNSIRRSWQAEFVSDDGNCLKLSGAFVDEVAHPDLGLIKKGTISNEIYWRDRWYSIFTFFEPDGTFRNVYCNINMPPRLTGDFIDYVDLDIDVVVWPDGRVVVLDEAEFESNALKFEYPEAIRTKVRETLDELITLADSGRLHSDKTFRNLGNE